MNTKIDELIDHVAEGNNLPAGQMQRGIAAIMAGECSDDQIARLLVALADKGETVDEVVGAAAAMRACMTTIRSERTGIVDTCGTGGGGSKTFNISTTAAIVAAAAGVPVAKHGNRSVTSRSGSADVLGELGVNLDATREQVEACLDELGLCFCFAPLVHPAMRHVGPVRKKLGIRTIFNILGPLANPAGSEFQLLGAGRGELRPMLATAMQKLGTSQTFVVCGDDGMGDVTCGGTTYVTRATPAEVADFEWTPADFGLAASPIDTLAIDTPTASAKLIGSILDGQLGPPRDVVILNAAAALVAAGAHASPAEAAAAAAEAIDSGGARMLLAQLAERSHRPA